MDTRKPINESEDKDLTPSELIKKHIDDPDHQITDEDIRNTKTGPEATAPEETEEEIKRREEEIKNESPEDDLPNPYNVVG